MSPQDKILDKLAKLRAAADGEAALGNTAAAESFAGMINSMLLKHELSIEDIPVGGVIADEPIIELRADLAEHGIKTVSGRVGWQEALARIVAEAHLCKFLVTTGTNRITFVGTKQHVTVAAYAYGVLCSAADRMSKAAYRQERRDTKPIYGYTRPETHGFRAGWIRGFIVRIAERFADARRAEIKATKNESQALMRLDNALVRAQAHVDGNYKTNKHATHINRGNRAGYDAGREAADAMKIGQKGVDGSSRKQLT